MVKELPRSLKEFIGYYWRYDPRRWTLFIIQDIIHYSRYPVAFLIVGEAVDILSRQETPVLTNQLYMMVAALFAILFFGEAMHSWSSYIIRHWKPKLRQNVRKDFYDYLLGHSYSYYQDRFAGSLTRKITEIAESSVRLHDHLRHSIFGSLIMMCSSAIALFSIGWPYGLVIMVFMATVILPVFFRLKRIGGRANEFSMARSEVTGGIVDTLSNAASMRNFAQHDFERQAHEAKSRREQITDSKRILTLAQIELYRRLCLVLLGTGMFLILLAAWSSGYVTVGEVSAVMGLTFSLSGATWMMGFGIIMVADELGYIDDAIQTINVPHEIEDQEKAEELGKASGVIRFQNVFFQFGRHQIFSRLDLDIPAGQKVGLLGPSGAGKSTLINLLLRLFDVDNGEIMIDGHNIRDISQDSLRRNIALIPQDTTLFHRSLIDNIRYGKLDASDDEVIEAAKKAHAHDFIENLAEGYQTEVGERGVKLSGGQRQRVIIARAILKDAPILVLDEATSALDSESERLIQKSLENLMKGKTVIAIAHRLSTISHLDRLIVMQEGQIIEDGSHEDLLARKGLYAQLWGMQSGGFVGHDHHTPRLT